MHEVYIALRNALLGDATLVAMLGGATEIYYGMPEHVPEFPAMVISSRLANPNTRLSGVGLFRPDFRLSVFAVDPYADGPIFKRLQEAWTIPKTRAAVISSDNYAITKLEFVQSLGGSGGASRWVIDDRPVHQTMVSVNMRVRPT